MGAGSGKFRSVVTWAAVGDTVALRHSSNPGLVELAPSSPKKPAGPPILRQTSRNETLR